MSKVILIALLVGCAGARSATIRGDDLYAHANELREDGKAEVPAGSHATLTVRANQYLVDRSADQVFYVRDVVAGCHGRSLDEDPECTLALLRDHLFVVRDTPPEPRRVQVEDSGSISMINKVRIGLVVAGTAMVVGAVKCEAFDGCKGLLGIGAGLDALLLLVTFTGMH